MGWLYAFIISRKHKAKSVCSVFYLFVFVPGKIQEKQDFNIVKKALREQKLSIIKELNEIEKEKIRISIQNENELHQQFLRHNEEKHALELEKMKLEIEILKEKLNK